MKLFTALFAAMAMFMGLTAQAQSLVTSVSEKPVPIRSSVAVYPASDRFEQATFDSGISNEPTVTSPLLVSLRTPVFIQAHLDQTTADNLGVEKVTAVDLNGTQIYTAGLLVDGNFVQGQTLASTNGVVFAFSTISPGVHKLQLRIYYGLPDGHGGFTPQTVIRTATVTVSYAAPY